jgi:flagellar biosynthesis/type III secretory pathway protein FliH
MTLARGRILRGERVTNAVAIVMPTSSTSGRRLSREARAADDEARAILDAAERRGAAIVEEATRTAEKVRKTARVEGLAEGAAELSALALRVAQRERALDEASLDRSIELARVLAERLLGHALSTDPASIAWIARSVLDEARGARLVKIHLHESDAPLLRAVVAELDRDGRIHEIVVDAEFRRGDLRLETDVGVIDARLGPTIERLAERLRELLRR